MKHLSGLWHKLTVVVAVTAALSSCNRAEYAMLPKTTSYHGTAHRAVTVAPTAEAPSAAETASVATTPEEVVAVRPAETPASTKAVAKATPSVADPVAIATPAKVTKAPKLNVVQKALVQKMVKKADKIASKLEFKQRTETAEVDRLGGRLRQGIILVIVGLLVGLLAFVGGPIGYIFGIISTILVLVGIVLIVLYLLDEL